ncbi:MAG: ankyrin repeat domain-containing protein [Bacteroidota bacterium]
MSEPIQGLNAFLLSRLSIFFFGREDSITDVLELIATKPFTAIVGFSGSGKSSLVYAGVLRKLHKGYIDGAEDGWQTVTITPAEYPMESLQEALLDTKWLKTHIENQQTNRERLREEMANMQSFLFKYPIPEKQRLLIVVDQFEEVFSEGNMGNNFRSTAEFIAILKTLTPQTSDKYAVPLHGINVLITIRADFIQKLIYFSELPSLFSNSIYFIPVIDNEGIKAAISQPAVKCKKSFEPELVDLLVKQCTEIRNLKRKRDSQLKEAEEDDTLPLLQHFLMHLWDTFPEEDQFTVAHYLKIGPLFKVIDKHLNDIYYFHFNKRQRVLTKFLFKTLSRRDKNNPKRIVRNPHRIEEIVNLFKSLNPREAEVGKITNEFREIIALLAGDKVKVLKIKNTDQTSTITHESLIDISHESIFRNWDLCTTWINQEVQKEADLEEIRQEIGVIEKYWGYEKIKDVAANEKFFVNPLWQKSKGIANEESKIASAILGFKKIQLKYAISNSDSTYLLETLDKIGTDGLNLSKQDLNYQSNDSFFPELYNALVPQAQRRFDDSVKADEKDNYWNTAMRRKAKNGYRVSHFAALAGNTDILKQLNKEYLFGEEYFTKSGNSPFSMALYSNQLETAQFVYSVLKEEKQESLLSKQDNVNIMPVQWAAYDGDLDSFAWLDSITDITKASKQGNALNFSVRKDNHKITEYLLNKGLDYRLADEEGYTPLHLACGFSSTESVKILLNHAKKNEELEKVLNQIDIYGITPLMRAVWAWQSKSRHQRLSVIKEILNHAGASIINFAPKNNSNQNNHNRWTALHFAVFYNEFEASRLLLTAGAKIDILDRYGETPLHLAAREDSPAYLHLLLKHAKEKYKPADFLSLLNTKNKKGLSPADIAYERSLFDNLYLLAEAGSAFSSFGEDYNFVEQKITKWPSEKIHQELLKLFEKKYQWDSSPSILEYEGWVIHSQAETLERYQKLGLTQRQFRQIEKIFSFRSHPLSFYPNVNLGEMKVNQAENSESIIFVYGPNSTTFLNGNSNQIHALNRNEPIQLNDHNVLEYLDFFCAMVHAKDGAFRIINSVDDIWWQDEEDKTHTLPFITFLLESYKDLYPKDEASHSWQLSSLVNYGNALFLANFTVSESGMIEMTSDIPIYSNMPIKIASFRSLILNIDKQPLDDEAKDMEQISFVYAAKLGLLEIMQWLYEHKEGLDINMKNDEGQNAWELAKENDHQAVVDWLASLPD